MSRSVFAVLIAAAAIAAPVAVQAQSAPLSVEIDHSARVQLRGAAGSVIVGNPAIADVTVVDANTLYIVGKGYGVTEVVAVDGIGRILFQNQIIVTAGNTGMVRVWRGTQPTDMACAASCAPSIRSPAGDGAAPTP